jgi:hypothetical protein
MIAISPDPPQRHGCVQYGELIEEAQVESNSQGRQRIEVICQTANWSHNVKINQSAGLIKKMGQETRAASFVCLGWMIPGPMQPVCSFWLEFQELRGSLYVVLVTKQTKPDLRVYGHSWRAGIMHLNSSFTATEKVICRDFKLSSVTVSEPLQISCCW